MRPGNPLGNDGQRAIQLARVLEPVVVDENRVGVFAPLARQVVPVFSALPELRQRAPFSNAPARVCRRRRSAALGPPWVRSCS